jgi:putative hydrolase of HD superfamily
MSGSPSLPARLADQMRFLFEADKLKEVLRRTRLPQSQRPENSAEHTWHIVLMATILAEHAPAGTDVVRVMKMLLIHDIVEIDAGDTFGYDTTGHADKRDREVRAAERIFGLLPADQAADVRALWDEFEAGETAESKYALAMDRFQAVMVNYLSNGGSWREHQVTADRVFARNQVIAHSSPTLWAYARGLIEDAVAKGHLPAGPKQ